MHGHRQEEDGVAVVSSRSGAEMLLHGLHDGEQLVCEFQHVVKKNLKNKQKGCITEQVFHLQCYN